MHEELESQAGLVININVYVRQRFREYVRQCGDFLTEVSVVKEVCSKSAH